jgi:hypothetical protein
LLELIFVPPVFLSFGDPTAAS